MALVDARGHELKVEIRSEHTGKCGGKGLVHGAPMLVHVLDERTQGALGHGLVEQHLIGLRVHHVRAVERDKQAVDIERDRLDSHARILSHLFAAGITHTRLMRFAAGAAAFLGGKG